VTVHAHAALASIVRSGFAEGLHYGTAVALDAQGQAVVAVGSPQAPIFPRSANKPLQAVGMLRAGLQLDGPLLALVAASHSGERYHLEGVRRILTGAGLDVEALRNTASVPMDDTEAYLWRVCGQQPSALAQNCSGKHAGMLATCVENGWPVDSYLDPAHPLQVGVADTIAELAGEPVAATGVDGCGAPVFAISPLGLARAFAQLAAAAEDTPQGRVAAAMRCYPEWVGGTGRDVTMILRGVPGLIAKDGAEAVYAGALPDGRAAAVKIADGGQRAAPVVLAALLRRLGVDAGVLDELARVTVLGHGEPVGVIEAVDL